MVPNKKTTINPKNNNDNSFQYAITVALNHQNINNHPERVTNIKPSIDKYNWNEIDFPSHRNNWKNFESNNKTIALNIFYVPYNTEEIRHEYKSNYNLNRKNEIILIMITDLKKLNYLALKSLSTLLRRRTFSHNVRFYCLNCLHSFTIENKLK